MANPNTISYSLTDGQNQGGNPVSKLFDITIARVTFVLLDNSNTDKFNKLGGWPAIGSIECIPFINFNDPNSQPIVAKPINTNITRYPVQNELVTVITLVSKEAQKSIDNYKPEYYYQDIISVFNEVEDNAAPDDSFLKLNPNSKSITGDYVSTGFNKKLIKAPGDITIEGRRGGSIRIGSSSPSFKTPWQSPNLNPILILSNNPIKVKQSVARFEDVNKDGSTLVMMSGHNINFQAASTNFDSYNTTVIVPQNKNNIVVVDQTPKSQPTQSLQQQDSTPIPPTTPVTGSIPVSNPIPPPVVNNAVIDEEKLPEREDLMEIEVQLEETIAFPPPSSLVINPPNSNTPPPPPNTPNTPNTGTTGYGTSPSTTGGYLTDQSPRLVRPPITKIITNPKTNKRIAEFINRYYDTAVIAAKDFSFDPIMILAQGAMETGWGTSPMCNVCNNFHGVTTGGKKNINAYWTGGIYKQSVKAQLEFRVYATPELAFKDFARLIRDGYKTAYSNIKNYKAYAKSIAYSPYINPIVGDNRAVYESTIITNYERIVAALK